MGIEVAGVVFLANLMGIGGGSLVRVEKLSKTIYFPMAGEWEGGNGNCSANVLRWCLMVFQIDPDPQKVGLGVIWDGYPESDANGGWSVGDLGVGLVEGLG
jgi:hypothetical protein